MTAAEGAASTWLDADTVDLLNRAADTLDAWAEHDDGYVGSSRTSTITRNTAAILRYISDPATAGPVLISSAIAIAKAVLGEDS